MSSTPTSLAAAALTTACVGGIGYQVVMSERSQWLGPFPYRGEDTGRREVALTFDDGPNEPYTTQLRVALAERGVRATFFQVARNVEKDPDVSRALLEDGHVIGNHSYRHRFRECFAADDVRREVDRAQEVFIQRLGIAPALYRPPWLVRVPALLDHLRARRMQVVSGLFCHPLEVVRADPARMAARVVRLASPGAMIIFHDGYNAKGADRSRTVRAATMAVDELHARGFTFVTVDQLLASRAYL